MRNVVKLYFIAITILLSSCSYHGQNSFSSSSNSITQISSNQTNISSVEVDNSIIEKSTNYLPDKVISAYYISGEKDGKYYTLIDPGTYGEVTLTGLEYDIVQNYNGISFSVKDSKENKYYLERGEKYAIVGYLTSYDSEASRIVLHRMSLTLFQKGHLDISENLTLSDDFWINPTSLGVASVKLSYADFSFETDIQIVEKGSRKKESYSINFKTDERFLGSSMKSPTFREGEKITFNRWIKVGDEYGPQADLVSGEVISINGFEYSKVETFSLPPMDIVVDYYTYSKAPNIVSYLSGRELN